MKRYYQCVNECGYKIGPYKRDYDEQMTAPHSGWRCNDCPEEVVTDEDGNEVRRQPGLKPAHEYNQRELAAMKRAENIALGLPPGGIRMKIQKAHNFGAGILDVE